MRKNKNVLLILWCTMIFCFTACDIKSGIENNKSAHDVSLSFNELNIIVSSGGYATIDITRSGLKDKPVFFRDKVECRDGLSAEIVFTEESGVNENVPSTKVVGDELTSINDGNYVIFAYDNSGVCKDYLKFTINGGVVSAYQADATAEDQWKGDNSLLTTNVKRYVCVKEAIGTTIDYKHGIVTFSNAIGSDFENYLISDMVEKQLNETDNELSFIMRRQVTCVRVKVNSVDSGIMGTSELSLLSSKTVCDKLSYNRNQTSMKDKVHPQDIVTPVSSSDSYNLGTSADFQKEKTVTSKTSTSDYDYYAYRDFYMLADANVTIRDFQLTLRNLKVGDAMSNIQWFSEQKIDFSGTIFAAGFDGKLKANHRYTLNVNLAVQKVYKEDDQYPKYPGKEDFYQWDAYEPYTTENDGAWGPGTRTYNPASTASATAIKCPSVADFQKYICGDVYWDEGTPFVVRKADGSLLREGGKALRLICGAYFQKASKIDNSKVDYSKYYIAPPPKLTDVSIRTNPDYFFLPCAGSLLNGIIYSPGSIAFYWGKDAIDEITASDLVISSFKIGINKKPSKEGNKQTYMLNWNFE